MARREFSKAVRAAAFDRANGHCERCSAFLYAGKFVFDHILPDYLGGEPTLDNCKVQCVTCDKPKTAADQTRIAKTKRQHLNHIGAKARKGRPMPGSRASGLSKRMDGTVVRRTPSPETP